MRYNTEICIGFTLVSLFILFALAGGCGGNTGSKNMTAEDNNKSYPLVYGMEVDYCEKLGYSYDYRMNETSGKMEEYCRLSKDIECEAWAFASGECHPEFMLCKKQGYLPKIGVEKRGNLTLKYPICIFPDGTYCKETDFFKHECHVDWKK
jgi:putative hemolysin